MAGSGKPKFDYNFHDFYDTAVVRAGLAKYRVRHHLFHHLTGRGTAMTSLVRPRRLPKEEDVLIDAKLYARIIPWGSAPKLQALAAHGGLQLRCTINGLPVVPDGQPLYFDHHLVCCGMGRQAFDGFTGLDDVLASFVIDTEAPYTEEFKPPADEECILVRVGFVGMLKTLEVTK